MQPTKSIFLISLRHTTDSFIPTGLFFYIWKFEYYNVINISAKEKGISYGIAVFDAKKDKKYFLFDLT